MGTGPHDRALAELVRERGAPLTRYAYLFTGDVAAAQDLVQDALVKVFLRTRAGFEPATLEAYVRRVIANLYVDGYRRRRTFASRRHLLAVEDLHDGHEAAVTEHAMLQEALSTLSPQERVAVVLRFFEDLTVPQVADAMNLGQGTVKRYLSNAMAKLAHLLGPIRELDESDTVLTHPTPRAGRI